ncbi:MAG: ECF-type sigma factor [Acidobacteriota bacterium]
MTATHQPTPQAANRTSDSRGGEVTRLLQRWQIGEAEARDELVAVLYDQLRGLAGSYMRNERAGHTLQPTALVHEAFLRMDRESSGLDLAQNRRQFFSVAAQAMRRILVEHARYHAAARRPSSRDSKPLKEGMRATPGESPMLEVLAVDEAMVRLKAADERMAAVVELRFFAGLEVAEVADVLELSESTVLRDWRVARLMLQSFLSEAPSGGGPASVTGG